VTGSTVNKLAKPLGDEPEDTRGKKMRHGRRIELMKPAPTERPPGSTRG
jgi:hypothetical protein